MAAAHPVAWRFSDAGFRRAAAGKPSFILPALKLWKPPSGCEVQIPLEQRAKLDPGNYYVGELIGCEVWEAGAAAAMGAVRDVEFPGGVPLLAVETNEGEVLVPLAVEFCVRIDIKAKRIDVALPDGLRDLNRG